MPVPFELQRSAEGRAQAAELAMHPTLTMLKMRHELLLSLPSGKLAVRAGLQRKGLQRKQ